MNRTFLVSVDVGSDTDFMSIANELEDALEDFPYNIVSVQPWNQHAGAALSFTPPQAASPGAQPSIQPK